ncbi:hypothetical protein KEM56_007256, partial [Ascosphaera pollenicola]
MSAASKIPSPAGGAIPSSSAPKARSSSPLLSGYLFLYNAVSFSLWGYILVSTIYLLATKYVVSGDIQLSSIYATIFPTLLGTQTLAVLEIIHSLLGLVRTSFVTTLMQVASRLFIVWPVLFCFGSHGYFIDSIGGESKAIIQPGGLGSYAFVGCIIAWSITECVRYSFFCMQVAGVKTPAVVQWL